MPMDDPYDTRIEKPTRGGVYLIWRGIVRILAFVVRFCIMTLTILALFNFGAIIAENAYSDSTLTNYLMPVFEWFWKIVPWGHVTALDFAVGERGVFHSDVFITIALLVALDAILDKCYDKLK